MSARALLLIALLAAPLAQASQHHLLIVSGLGGTDEYRAQFRAASLRLYEAAIEAGLDSGNIALLTAAELPDDAPPRQNSDKATLLRVLRDIDARAQPGDRVFVVLIGHGNPRADGAAFNLPGPDITAAELATELDSFADRHVVIVNTASASGPFVRALSAPGRIVITATSSGREYHATLFGEHFVAAFAAPGADSNKDQRISMLEAFTFARHEVKRAYESDKKLLIEHALLDDNGDGEGSLEPGELEPDGALAYRTYLRQPPALALGASPALVGMIQRKQEIEQSIEDLKRRRQSLAHDDYYAQLETLLIDLALLGREIRALED